MNKTLIIAEAGVNHNGNIDIAMKLIDVAVAAGVDYVKFQTFKAEKLVTKSAIKAAYQLRNTKEDSSQYSMLKELEMSDHWHYKLKDYCEQKGISFLSSGFDEESIDFLELLGTPVYKVPSGEITNRPYLENIARKGKPVILSTGMADLNEIKDAMKVFIAHGITKDMITVLHCNTEYPSPMNDVNLLAMCTIRNELGVKVGYSDHTLGIEVPIAAVALGASVIEKHFTLDRSLPGPDHSASLEPGELAAMVTAIRNIELSISGNGEKKASPSEENNKTIARKSIHLRRNLVKGHRITIDDLEMKRPGDGISPMQLDNVLGKCTKTALPMESKLSFDDIE